jgi:hypothetical protein
VNRTLWIAQSLLAALFLFAGISKLVLPIQPMVDQSGLSAGFLRFVGVMETLGGLGLILPGVLRICTWLTPLAASGLVIIMIGATTITVQSGMGLVALFPCLTGIIATFIAYGRWRLAPVR